MFGIGSTELIVILLVALIVLGPKNLAGISRTLGRIMGEFRRVSTDFQRTLNAEAAADDLREKEEQRKKEVAASPVQQTAAIQDPKVSGQPETNSSSAQAVSDLAQNSQPEDKNASPAGTVEKSASHADKDSSTRHFSQAEANEDEGMALSPPPDSPLARALAQTSAEAARAEKAIAEAASQAERLSADGGDGKNDGTKVEQGKAAVDSPAPVRTYASTGGNAGARA